MGGSGGGGIVTVDSIDFLPPEVFFLDTLISAGFLALTTVVLTVFSTFDLCEGVLSSVVLTVFLTFGFEGVLSTDTVET